MDLRLNTESKTSNFTTELGGCIAWAVENTGTSTLNLELDEAAFELPAGTVREFSAILGCNYTGKLKGQFVKALPEDSNKALIIKTNGVKK
jgi:hypothetical protein